MADSITTWRMAMMASTARGALGSGTASLKVFQDFFVDLDMPVTLTQGDRVSIPVAVVQLLRRGGRRRPALAGGRLVFAGGRCRQKNVAVESGRVGGAQFTLEAKRIGKFKLTLSARMTGGAKRADIVVREIEVVPNGREQNMVFNGRLESTVRHDVNFPAATIPDASKIFVRLYPGPLSQVIEGMDAILRMPGGCFEQTSSSTYPNVLALDYMKRTKKLTPEVHAKAEGYIANGYQRLLTFEVPGGGFSWFGQAPANKILTSYGLMEFSDMSKVLRRRPEADPAHAAVAGGAAAGGRKLEARHQLHQRRRDQPLQHRRAAHHRLHRLGAAEHRLPGPGGREGAAVTSQQHMGGKVGRVHAGGDRQLRRGLRQGPRLHGARDADCCWMRAPRRTDRPGGARKRPASIATGDQRERGDHGAGGAGAAEVGRGGGHGGEGAERTSRRRRTRPAPGAPRRRPSWRCARSCSPPRKGSADVRGTVEVSLNGKTVETLTLTPENNDLLHQFVLQGVDSQQANAVELRFAGKGGLAYQVVGRYFVPWDEEAGARSALDRA